MRRFALPMLLLTALASLWWAGPEGLGRLALRLGYPAVASQLLTDPAARGVAFYRAGRYREADAAFTEAGRGVTFNRGITLALTGEYRLAVAYFDAVLFANPADREARANRAAVAALIEPVVGEGDGKGRISAVEAARMAAQAAIARADQKPIQRAIRKMLNNRHLVADDDWLATLSDAPGEFLARRLRAEFDRRAAAGLVRPEEGEPW